MKKTAFILAFLLIVMPTLASAHTQLESSTPESGQVVKEELSELVLNFGGEIESLSTLTLVKDGKEVPLKSVEPNGTQLIGTIESPLDNGTYTIQWKIVGEDGHVITGDIPFSVQMEQAVEELETEEPSTEEPTKTEDTNPEGEDEVKREDTADQNLSNNQKSGPSFISIVIPAIVILLLGIGMFMLFGRKK
ncbi:hypothetical protein A8F94_22620 [Bacillus sp. FJAT-27225]|uniref:copper resistance CopC family protein n=1 Tax=Bacillus sp. FJAT-27225 TaxID=1743144 RepID=UPI00080C2219|nr:copper resistance protein CopC [Bacillus sp. FJAT-27225]OCA81657.1 hypothetical protein A8F94_22620 [Bacillus sp. FJAT-27225]